MSVPVRSGQVISASIKQRCILTSNPIPRNTDLISRSTCTQLISSAFWPSRYRTCNNAEVHAPPAFPAGFGKSNFPTLKASAEVWLSWLPSRIETRRHGVRLVKKETLRKFQCYLPEIMWNSAGIRSRIDSWTFDMVLSESLLSICGRFNSCGVSSLTLITWLVLFQNGEPGQGGESS